jgi:hypothetical protein
MSAKAHVLNLGPQSTVLLGGGRTFNKKCLERGTQVLGVLGAGPWEVIRGLWSLTVSPFPSWLPGGESFVSL